MGFVESKNCFETSCLLKVRHSNRDINWQHFKENKEIVNHIRNISQIGTKDGLHYIINKIILIQNSNRSEIKDNQFIQDSPTVHTWYARS